MKHKAIFLGIFFFIIFTICSYALENDFSSIELSEQAKVQQELESFSNIPITNELAFRTVNAPAEKSIDLLVYAGLGTTLSSILPYISHNEWNDFYLGPVGLIGVEIPFTQSHIFGFKVYANRWVGKYIDEEPETYEGSYDYLGNGYYSGYGISGILKCYFVGKHKKFRISLNLGGMFGGEFPLSYHIEMGWGMYYKIDNS